MCRLNEESFLKGRSSVYVCVGLKYIHLERRANLDIFASLDGVNLTDKVACDTRVTVHDAVHVPSCFD